MDIQLSSIISPQHTEIIYATEHSTQLHLLKHGYTYILYF